MIYFFNFYRCNSSENLNFEQKFIHIRSGNDSFIIDKKSKFRKCFCTATSHWHDCVSGL